MPVKILTPLGYKKFELIKLPAVTLPVVVIVAVVKYAATLVLL